MKESEKRVAPRFQGILPVKLKGGKGTTRDLSSAGIFFETDRFFSTGKPIAFAINLEYFDLAGPVRMKCRGKIVRVEESGQKIGVVATITSYSFGKPRDPVKSQGKRKKPTASGAAKKNDKQR